VPDLSLGGGVILDQTSSGKKYNSNALIYCQLFMTTFRLHTISHKEWLAYASMQHYIFLKYFIT
jgi:hypothetical protein